MLSEEIKSRHTLIEQKDIRRPRSVYYLSGICMRIGEITISNIGLLK